MIRESSDVVAQCEARLRDPERDREWRCQMQRRHSGLHVTISGREWSGSGTTLAPRGAEIPFRLSAELIKK